MRWQTRPTNVADFEWSHKQGFFDAHHFLNPPEEDNSSEDDEVAAPQERVPTDGCAKQGQRHEAPRRYNE